MRRPYSTSISSTHRAAGASMLPFPTTLKNGYPHATYADIIIRSTILAVAGFAVRRRHCFVSVSVVNSSVISSGFLRH